MLIRLSPNQRDFLLHILDSATVQGRALAAMLCEVGVRLENPEAPPVEESKKPKKPKSTRQRKAKAKPKG